MIESSHRLVGAYAADALDDAEREDFEAHLAECAECRAEADSLTEAAASLAESTAVAPPPELRASIMDQIATVRPLPPLTAADPEPAEAHAPVTAAAEQPYDELAARRTRRRRLVATLGAAAAAVVLAVSLGVAQPWADDLSPAQQVLEADDALSSSVDLGDGARATVVHSESIGQSVIQTEDMPPPPAGSVYQLWYAEDGDFVSAGLMPAEAGDQTVRLQGDSREASGVGVTVEPEGGSDSPTSEPIAMFDFGPAA